MDLFSSILRVAKWVLYAYVGLFLVILYISVGLHYPVLVGIFTALLGARYYVRLQARKQFQKDLMTAYHARKAEHYREERLRRARELRTWDEHAKVWEKEIAA